MPGVNDEGLEARFFAPDEIPWDALAFRSTAEALAEFLEVSIGESPRK